VIVDAHHHVWRRADLPWLEGPMQPRIFGAYQPIRRDYPMAEYLDDLAGTGVARSVYAQANWAPHRFLDEVAWVEAQHARTGWPHAIAAYADMAVDDARPQLDALARFRLVRAIRMQLHWHESPQYRFAARPDLVADPKVIANVALLARYGWAFELQVFAGQLEHACRLVDACPDVTFILQHALMLEDASPAGLAAWRAALADLARRPNVTAKLSGLGTFLHRVDPAHVATVTAVTVAAFGARRCLWGSNFPIEKLWASYGTLLAAHQAATAGLPAPDRRAIWGETAMKVYRLA
jgi:predicted TIM-barrel fold metal-dependent hydrolase